ncbi:MAG: FtsX-like permease family protein [Dehalococcoidia bacterium]
MDALFGIPMQAIMIVLLGILALSMLSVGYVFFANRVMFRMGLRNLPRRGLQTGLIILGLMLATLIITAAFTTGDTVDYSVSSKAYDQWQRTDLNINLRGDDSEDAIGPEVWAPAAAAAQLDEQFADDADIELFLPFLYSEAAASNGRSGLSEPRVNLVGVDTERLNEAGGLRPAGGGSFDLTTLASDEALVSERAADELDAREGDTLSLYVQGREYPTVVAAIVKDEQASGVVGDFDDSTRPGGVVMPLSSVQEMVGQTGNVNYISVALAGDVRGTVGPEAEESAERVSAYASSPEGNALLGLQGEIGVEAVKSDDVEAAEEFGNIFTSFFLVVGLFSIAAGIMLIFMIFVMLAAERKPEMGMARAVGAQRGNLVQAFLAEGMSYNLLAGVVGAALGVGAALVLMVGFLRLSLGDDFDFIQSHVTIRSVVVSYCLGVSLTFVTVVIASIQASGVNIVAAIRGTPEDETPEPRQRVSWRAVLAGIPAMIVPPLGIWLLFRKGLGVSWAWIFGPAGLALGAVSILAASGSGSEFLFSFGFSVLPLSVAILAAHYRAPARLTWTVIGVYLAAYWLSPWNIGEEVLGRELTGDIEMFVLSGIMVVIAFTLIIVFNARLLNALFPRGGGFRYRVPAAASLAFVAVAVAGVALGDAWDGVGQLLFLAAGLLALVAALSFASVTFPRLGPAFKMGVAYPLSNRFRTGMTIAMFSLIIFSLTTFSAVNANFAALLTGEDGDGGWDVVTTANEGARIGDLRGALEESGAPVADDIEAAGSVSAFRGQQEVRQSDDDWTVYPVIAAGETFLAPGTVLDSMASGYDDDDDVLSAVRQDPSLALVDATAVDGFNNYDWSIDIDVEDDRFEPVDVSFRDAATGAERTVTVVGVWASRLTDRYVSGIYVNPAAYEEVFGLPSFDRTYVRLEDGVDAKQAARNIEASLATRGVQADSVRQLIDEASSQERAFTRMFQAFMALGLFVGIAALGVIAFRSVVERRQQIGMLRAIGYQTESIALTFVLESTFVAAMGILSGVVGGVIVSRNLFTTGQFSGEGIEFSMPWGEVAVFVGLALIVSLIMTWWPSRNAAGVPVAEALRYE